MFATVSIAADYIVLESKNGGSILAQPLLLKDGNLSIKRNDGVEFNIQLDSLNEDSQSRVFNYFGGQIAEKIESTAPKNARSSSQVFEYTEDGDYISKAYYPDPSGDDSKMHDRPEMDITEVMLEMKAGNRMLVQLTFAEHSKSIYNGEYRIWVSLDLDNDPTTGMIDKGGYGQDISIAISGDGSSSRWSYYTVPKSDLGKKTSVEIEDIEVGKNTISFVINSPAVKRSAVFGIGITACADLGKNIDSFPAKGALPFSFDAEKHKAISIAGAQ